MTVAMAVIAVEPVAAAAAKEQQDKKANPATLAETAETEPVLFQFGLQQLLLAFLMFMPVAAVEVAPQQEALLELVAVEMVVQ